MISYTKIDYKESTMITNIVNSTSVFFTDNEMVNNTRRN